MKRRLLLWTLSISLALSSTVFLSGCAPSAQAADLTTGIKSNNVELTQDLSQQTLQATDFSLRLFQASAPEGQNALISPFSVLSALAMTSNGAKANTLAQMETVFGLSPAELNNFLYSYTNTLPQGEDYKLNVTNSIWLKDTDRFTANANFLQINADYYNAAIYQSAFDSGTVKDINTWISKQTDGMIKDMIEELSPNSVMCLINAIAFDAQWESPYYDYQVRDGDFTKENGQVQHVQLMYSEEHQYLEDENATGFIKYYADRGYAFVALLPKEGVSVDAYLDALTAQGLSELLDTPQDFAVNAAIPLFEGEFTLDMSELLSDMGMRDAFSSSAADFSGLGQADANIFISQVLHKAFISVHEQGTKAGAATVVTMDAGSAAPEMIETKEVLLDRPFVYMLIDCQEHLPLFIGTAMEINE